MSTFPKWQMPPSNGSDSIDAIRKDLILPKLSSDTMLLDELYVQIKQDLIALVHEDAESGSGPDLMQIAKYYERIGDHATNTNG